MPFTYDVRSYIAPQLIAGGIQSGTNAMSEALQKYAEDKAKVGFADTVMDYAKTVPGAVTPEALQKYAQANAKEKAYIALGAGSNLKNIFGQQAQEWQNRMYGTHANYYQAAAERERATAAAGGSGGGPGKGKIWCEALGGYATPAQCKAEERRTTEGGLWTNYGLSKDDIANSNIHEAGDLEDPANRSSKFTPKAEGKHIRIGGEQGPVMPLTEFNTYKRQLGLMGGTQAANGGTTQQQVPEGNVMVRDTRTGKPGYLPENQVEAAVNSGKYVRVQ